MTGTARPEDHRNRRRRLAAALAAIAALAVVAPAALSGATFTSGSRNTGRVSSAMDWTPPTVELTDPGDAIRGTVALTATATDGETAIARVVFAWSPSDSGAWTTLCTDLAAPWSCPFATTSLPEDEVDLRAIATDGTGLTATDVVEGVLVDNTAPTASIGTVPGTFSGAVTIPVTAADAGSGVDTVAVQWARSGTSTWTTICTDLEEPWSCRWDTTTVASGLYDVRAIATDAAGNATTTASVRNKLVDNTLASVSVDDPGATLRGTVAVTASANALTGVASVRIQRQLSGTSTWTDLCVDASSPYSCTWNTTTVADGLYSLRAILTDNLGLQTTSSVVGPTKVDNTVVRGYDVQGTNGAVTGKLAAGDRLVVTYTRAIAPATVLAGWDGSARSVTVRVRDGGVLGLTNTNDTLDVFTSTAFSTTVNLGSIDLRGNYVRSKKTVGFTATMTMQAVTVDGVAASSITLVLGGQTVGTSSNLRSTSAKPAMVWTPSALAKDTFGIASSTTPATERGVLDADL